jgi:hypothetical protein
MCFGDDVPSHIHAKDMPDTYGPSCSSEGLTRCSSFSRSRRKRHCRIDLLRQARFRQRNRHEKRLGLLSPCPATSTQTSNPISTPKHYVQRLVQVSYRERYRQYIPFNLLARPRLPLIAKCLTPSPLPCGQQAGKYPIIPTPNLDGSPSSESETISSLLSLNTAGLKNDYEAARSKADRLKLLAKMGSAEKVRSSLFIPPPLSLFLSLPLDLDSRADDMVRSFVESKSGRSRGGGRSSRGAAGGGEGKVQGDCGCGKG